MSKNRTEMHKLLERLIEGKTPEEAVAMLKEILVEYFGFGSSIELEELALILGQIANDYNEDEAQLDEDEVAEGEKSSRLDELEKIVDDLTKKINNPPIIPQPIQPQIPINPLPDPYRKKRTPGPYEVDPYERPWVGESPGWNDKYKYTMQTAIDSLKNSDVKMTPEVFSAYVSSLASRETH